MIGFAALKCRLQHSRRHRFRLFSIWLPTHCRLYVALFCRYRNDLHEVLLTNDTNHLAELSDETVLTKSQDHVASTIDKPIIWTKLKKLCKASIYELTAVFWVVQIENRVVTVLSSGHSAQRRANTGTQNQQSNVRRRHSFYHVSYHVKQYVRSQQCRQ